MSALAPIVINDGKATPVAHTFNPSQPDSNGVVTLYDRVTGVVIGYWRMTLSLTVPPAPRAGMESKAGRIYKAKLALFTPIMESSSAATGTGIPPAPTVAYECQFMCTFNLPERSDLAARKDILALAKNYLANTNVTNLVENLESMY